MDAFWFDELNEVNKTFNNYYDEISKAGLNDIDSLLNGNKDIYSTLLQTINCIDEKDARLIELKLLQYKVKMDFI